MFFFFFKQKTAYEIGTGDWSSDVCSSDLAATIPADMAQFYGYSLKLAQEISYVYGYQNIWANQDELTEDRKSVV